MAEASLSVNVSPMADAIEEDAVALDVIADAVIVHVDAPLADAHGKVEAGRRGIAPGG